MIKSIGIVGAGTMGSGIAEVAALAGIATVLTDTSEPTLTAARERIAQSIKRAVGKKRVSASEAEEANARITLTPSLADLTACDLVVEAIIEDEQVKRDLFRQLDRMLAPHAILGSNTSSLSITALASATQRPDKVVGIHFFNPVPLMKLVEVVQGRHTSNDTALEAFELAQRLGKTAVLCKDTPGFIVNRIARPFYGEALRLLGEGVASAEQIDYIVKTEGGFKMGPFELMDLIGIDVNYAVTKSVYEQFAHEPRFRPHAIQKQMVDAGTLGRKAGRGFFDYAGAGPNPPKAQS
ncbi:MAG: 3-hydroxybutyryl-CoA dehydrogenase [Ignavibacteriae bacterium]|nr:3-hydroxybutyryl-CoA dehydrogenase [Ignavibacteriota bacterium]